MIDITRYNNNVVPTWCPGCGNFGIHMAIKKALSELDISPKDAFISFDIGCNGNGADKININGYKGLHGRSIPLAVGVKLANRKLTVIADIGDGGVLHEGDHEDRSSDRPLQPQRFCGAGGTRDAQKPAVRKPAVSCHRYDRPCHRCRGRA